MQERAEFTADLFELHEAHRRNLGLTSEWFQGRWDGFSFYSNCEIARVDLWTQPIVKDYLRRIDEAGGIYKVGVRLNTYIHTYAHAHARTHAHARARTHNRCGGQTLRSTFWRRPSSLPRRSWCS